MLKSNIDRRKLLISSAGVLSVAAVSSVVRGQNVSKYSSEAQSYAERLDSDQVATIASRAVEVAQANGALYSDVRITRRVNQILICNGEVSADVIDTEHLGINVRVLIDGYWGFAASPYWDEEEAAQLAEEAVHQARANAARGPKAIEWYKLAPEKDKWIAPGVDPMTITLEEKIDFVNSWRTDVSQYRDGIHQLALERSRLGFNRHEWWFCNSEGSELHQVFFDSSGYLALQAGSPTVGRGMLASLEDTVMQMGGWEVFLNARIKDRIPELVEKSMETAGIGVTPVDIGRSNLVIDGFTAGTLLGSTFASTTQLDQILGYEANDAGGTSYLGPDPYEFLGKPVASPLITISANRNNPSGLATRKWDDEGVVPQSFDIVKDGTLVDCQTNRELSSELKDWYNSQGRDAVSRGCVSSGSGLDSPMIFTPNVDLVPSVSPMSFESIVSNTESGYALFNYYMQTSFQGKDGFAIGSPLSYAREIVNGKLGNFVGGLGVLFRTDELWKNVIALGDETTVKQLPWSLSKGQPKQSSAYSIRSVPISIKDVAIIDPSRRA